ncbi:sortilin-related receptor-like [Folsomia candida]|uniref:sortilin-related receptor-like n=1 Tax=Folsomia candida TaxID=158441 RepID=UPI001604CDEF|nr:sortilin-related receptor-like [Folsomia candida]
MYLTDFCECFNDTSRCDGYFDCLDESDESLWLCSQEPDTRCDGDAMKCGLSKICRPLNSRCDMVKDCPGGEDEFDCPTSKSPPVIGNCDYGQFFCDGLCKPAFRLCDKLKDCWDGRDESNCTNHLLPMRQVSTIEVILDDMDYEVIQLRWWIDMTEPLAYFKPSLCDKASNSCLNTTIWTNQTHYEMRNGKDGIEIFPFWRYYVKIFVKIGKQEYPPGVYNYFKTTQSEPGVPLRVQVSQIRYNRVNVSWARPAYANGYSKEFQVYSDPLIWNDFVWGGDYFETWRELGRY